MNHMMKLPAFSLSNVSTGVLSVGTLVLLLGVSPFSENLLDDSKLYTLFLITIIMGVLFAITVIKREAIELVLSKLTFANIAFLIATAASTILVSSYPVKGLLGYGGVFIATGLLVLFASPLLTKTSHRVWFTTFLGGTLLLVLASVLELMGYGPSRLLPLMGPFNSPSVPVLFSLSGSILNTLQLCIIAVAGIFATWLATKKAHPVQLVVVVVLLLGILLYGYNLLPGKSSLRLPSFGSSWSLALDSVRDPRGALIGSGTGSYQAVYQHFKPMWMNGTPDWATLFNVGANMPLTLLTMTGFVGLVAWLFLFVTVCLQVKKTQAKDVPPLAMLITTFVLQLLFPPNVVIIAIQAVLMALFIASKRQEDGILHFNFFHVKIHRLTQMLPGKQAEPRGPLYLTSGIILILLTIASYYLGRFYLGSYYSLAAVKSFQANDALGVYNNQWQAIAYNSSYDLYHRRYAITSVGIAEILAEKTDKTAQDSETISRLIQQAVSEGKAAVTLDPTDAQNYALTASIYQRLIGGVDGSETFAEQYYVQAINLYPSAPELYVSLAGIYFKQEKWDQAARVLNQALIVKDDYPNTHYNLAFALEKLKAFEQAKAQYERTLTFVADPNSNDYAALTKKIEEMGKLSDEQKNTTKKPADTTTAPSAVDLNLNNTPQENVQVNQQVLPESTPAASPPTQAAPTPEPAP